MAFLIRFETANVINAINTGHYFFLLVMRVIAFHVPNIFDLEKKITPFIIHLSILHTYKHAALLIILRKIDNGLKKSNCKD